MAPSSTSQQRYQEIAAYLRDAISLGALQPGDELPSESELCEQFEASRGPVRQAVSMLRAEGLISTGRGRRTTVLSNARGLNFESIISTSSWLESLGLKVSHKILSLGRMLATEEIADLVGLEVGDVVVNCSRLRHVEDTAFSTEVMWLPYAVGKVLLNSEIDEGSLHRELASHGFMVESTTRSIKATVATEHDADLLGVAPNDAMLIITNLGIDIHGQILYYSESRYPAEVMTISLSASRGIPSPISASLSIPKHRP